MKVKVKLKKLEIMRINVEYDVEHPVFGRILLPFYWFKLIAIFRFRVCGENFYRIAVPHFCRKEAAE